MLATFLPITMVVGKNTSTTFLNEWPMIMAHDAATTYLKGGFFHQINDWTKTQQDGGAAGLLQCGTRSFDWRPRVKSDGSVVMHHGDITVDHPMSDSLDEMVRWCQQNTAVEDLVVLGVTHVDGDLSAVLKLLEARNITYVSDCSELKGLTVEAAAKKAALPGGGSLLAVADGCFVSNYEPAVTCSGFNSDFLESRNVSAAEALNMTEVLHSDEDVYTCYADSSSKAFPLDRMWQYLANVSAAGPPESGALAQAQALWQESATTIAIGEAHGSTLLDDETASKLNSQLIDRIKSGAWEVSHINLVEINAVCDSGLQLLAALRAIP